MNKLKQNLEKRRVLNQLKYSSLSGSQEGSLRAYASETEKHIYLKYLCWIKLKKAGYSVYTEVTWKSGIRMDLLAFREGSWINIEVLSSETLEELEEKTKKYPDIELIPVQSEEDINHLEI